MLPIILITSALMAAGAALDGKSTVDFLTKGKGAFVEANPFMVFLYGTASPSSKRVWVTGALVIAAEIGIALLCARFGRVAVWGFGIQQVVQAGVHLYEYFRNEKDLAAYLKTV